MTSGLSPTNITSNKKTRELWLLGGNATEVFYKDKDNANKKTYAGNVSGVGGNAGALFARIDYGDTKDVNVRLNVTGGGATGTGVILTVHTQGDSTTDLAAGESDIYMNWSRAANGGISALGITKSSEEAGEIKWGLTQTNMGTKDENHRERYGIIIKDPKSQGASDKVVFKIPGDEVQANIVVKPGTGSLVSAGGTSSGVAISTYATAPSAVLDTEVTTPADNNLILVGGPAVNKLSAQFLGKTYPAYGADSGLKEGEAVLELKDNGANVALIVAGWAGEDTRRAAKVLQSYKAFSTQLKGTSVKVAGTTSSPTIVTSA